jgi:hypothetical protein
LKVRVIRSTSDPKSSVTTFNRMPMRARSCWIMLATRSLATLPAFVITENSTALPERSRNVDPAKENPLCFSRRSALSGLNTGVFNPASNQK